MKILKKILPYFIGFIGGVLVSKSDAGQSFLNKIPFLGKKEGE